MFELYLKGGILMHAILASSIVMLSIVLERTWYFWRAGSREISREFEQIEALLLKGERKEAAALAAELSGPIGRVLQTGLNRTEDRHEITEERMAIFGEALMHEAEKGLSLLALIPSISTLLGLLGTVLGLVMAFQKVAFMEGNVSPALLASGIWVALLTTVAGLLVAIPALVAHYYIQNRLSRLTFEMEHFANRLLLVLKNTEPVQEPARAGMPAQHPAFAAFTAVSRKETL